MSEPDRPITDFSRRSTQPELMDDPACGEAAFTECLVDLAKVNRLTLAYRPTLAWLDRLVRHRPQGQPLRILDVGCGYGDMLRQVDRWAGRRGVAVTLTGIDLNPWSRTAATAATGSGRPIQWLTGDLFDYRASAPVDVVLSSLFTHHLSDPQLIRFLRWMEATATMGWFVNDLHRHRLPYAVFRRAAKLAGWHAFVQHDGPVSIARAFVPDDWRRLLAAADVPEGAAEIAWWFPFRLAVGRIR